ncbi:hypothetical protein GCM10011371_07860 [Novosphingobium marinum]|uniref:DUF2842 domain-containing protein n=2 Tax=Novosphingobium marinum TaxID=1514948 RepID=A0A7Z0BST7_9SPHN|nr:hypothetical protein [Novosphingobium marinum]GGC22588.1 hypothetical protein GCM10011371_07860 [Novosphingobium marinum]
MPMRTEPTWRIPFGILSLCIALAAYALAVAFLVAPAIQDWPVPVQTPVYLLLGVAWLLPLRRFLIWMETGRWRHDT